MINDGDIDRGAVFIVFSCTMGGAFMLGRAGPQITLINAARGAATSMLDIIDRVCVSPLAAQMPHLGGLFLNSALSSLIS